jgi:hypothetical protein
LTEDLCSSLRIVNVLGCEISLKKGSRRSSSYPTRPIPRRVAACRTQALHELTGAEKVDRDAGHRIPGTGDRTADARTPDAGRWTRTGRRTLDTHRTPDVGRADAGRADTGHVDAAGTRTGRPRHGGHPDILVPRRRWDAEPVLLWAAAAHTALGNHDGSAVRPPASARDCRLQCQATAGSLCRRPSGASAHCCPRNDSGRA